MKKEYLKKPLKVLKKFATGRKKNIEGIFVEGNNPIRGLSHKDFILDTQIK